MIEDRFKPDELFFDIYEDLKGSDISQRDCYDKAEVLFMHKVRLGFGVPLRKFDNFESFRAAYARKRGS